MDFLAPPGALGALGEMIFLVCLYVQFLKIFDSFGQLLTALTAIFQPQMFAILSYGLQTEFLASIVLDDVKRVATIFFLHKSSGHH